MKKSKVYHGLFSFSSTRPRPWKTLQEMICSVCVLRRWFTVLTKSTSCCLAMTMHNMFACKEETLAEMACIKSSRLEKALKNAKSKTSDF